MAEITARKKTVKKPEPKEQGFKRKKDKVAILGFAESKKLAPWDDPDFEFWGVNEMWSDTEIKKLDLIFEIHDYKWLCEGKRIKQHIDWLRKNKEIPIFMQQHFDDIPLSLPFPRAELEARFGKYFTNTISWEMALAIVLGFKEIHLYGINMANEIEYASQRPSCEYFLGIIEGMRQAGVDIKYYIPPESDLLKSFYQYGFEDGELSIMATRMQSYIDEQNNRANAFRQRIEQDSIALHQSIGASHAVNYMKKAFIYPHTNNSETPSEGGKNVSHKT